MRVSVKKTDTGYGIFSSARDANGIIRVSLDGSEISRDCVTADDDEGLVEVLARDDSGEFVLTPDGESIETKILNGKVEITISYDDAPSERAGGC